MYNSIDDKLKLFDKTIVRFSNRDAMWYMTYIIFERASYRKDASPSFVKKLDKVISQFENKHINKLLRGKAATPIFFFKLLDIASLDDLLKMIVILNQELVFKSSSDEE